MVDFCRSTANLEYRDTYGLQQFQQADIDRARADDAPSSFLKVKNLACANQRPSTQCTANRFNPLSPIQSEPSRRSSLPNQLRTPNPTPLPNRPFKMPIPITSNQPLAPPTLIPIHPARSARNHSPLGRNLFHKIPHRNPASPLNRLAPAAPPASDQVQSRAGRLREEHSAPGSGGVCCCWVCSWKGCSFCCCYASTSGWERNTNVPPPDLHPRPPMHHILPARRQIAQHW